MERRPDAAEPARARGEHERPGRRDDRGEPRGDERISLTLRATFDAGDHVHGNLVDVLGQVADGVADARALALAEVAPLEIRIRDLAPELTECGLLPGVGDDDEMPVLRVRS